MEKMGKCRSVHPNRINGVGVFLLFIIFRVIINTLLCTLIDDCENFHLNSY